MVNDRVRLEGIIGVVFDNSGKGRRRSVILFLRIEKEYRYMFIFIIRYL